MNILFVCSANMDRSPTAEEMYRNVPGWNVRSAGTLLEAVNPVTLELIDWADYIVVMEDKHRDAILRINPGSGSKIHVLCIEDNYRRNSGHLIKLIEEKMKIFLDSINENTE